MTNAYTINDFMEHVHVFSSMNMAKDSPARAGSQCVKAMLIAELEKFKFSNVVSAVSSYTSEEVKAFTAAMHYKKIYITTHVLTKGFQYDTLPALVNKPFNIRPRLNFTDYIDNGKPAEHHIQIIGGINTGKTVLVNMARKVLSELCPTAEVIVVDTDPYTFNFYYGDDAERESFLTNVRHQKINIGIPMLRTW